MKAILATIIIIHHDKYQSFAGVLYQEVQDAEITDIIIIDPESDM